MFMYLDLEIIHVYQRLENGPVNNLDFSQDTVSEAA